MSERFPPRHLAFGVLMGSADVIPGVSGGTVALIVGIYERLIDSIRQVAGALVALPRDRELARARWQAAEWSLVVPLAAGILLALAVGSIVIPPLLERYPVEMLALFFGLVAGSVPVPWMRIDQRRSTHLGLVALAAVVAFVLVGFPPASISDPSLPQVFASAAFAICAMILPGVSGAFLLKVLGIYETTLAAARDLDLVYIGTFALGAILGLALFAKLLSWLLHTRHDATMAVLVGLMVGALRALWPWQAEDRALLAPSGGGETLVALALALVGFAAVVALTRAGSRQITEAEPVPER